MFFSSGDAFFHSTHERHIRFRNRQYANNWLAWFTNVSPTSLRALSSAVAKPTVPTSAVFPVANRFKTRKAHLMISAKQP
jgi:hypothetical protein